MFCEQCSLDFTSIQVVRQHLQDVHGAKPGGEKEIIKLSFEDLGGQHKSWTSKGKIFSLQFSGK